MSIGMKARLGTIAAALGEDAADEDRTSRELIASIREAAGDAKHDVGYLVLAVLYGEIPLPDEVVRFTRHWRLDGLERVIEKHMKRARRRVRFGKASSLPIRVVKGIVADVTDTSRSSFTTGIQRVARETLSRWHRDDREVTLAAWDLPARRLVCLSAEEIERVLLAPVAPHRPAFLVPFRATILLPEIAVDGDRTKRLSTIASYSGSRTVAIAFDCIPVTTAETAGPGMPGAFSKYLSMLANFDAVAPISDAAGQEYAGWRRMLAGAGLEGPRIEVTTLPYGSNANAPEKHPKALASIGLNDSTIVLSVGSREPRKNHLNLLHAAELNWRAGREFALVLVGGNAWESHLIDEFIARLQRRGRKLLLLSGVSDDLVWGLYERARFSVFCSFNEGFGLPVVESLSQGTPVITANFGSMRALGEGHGAVLVDPHKPTEIADAMARLLDDDGLLSALAVAAERMPRTTWDQYSNRLWRLLMNDETAP